MKWNLIGIILSGAFAFQALPAYSASIQSTIAAYEAEDCAPVVEEKLNNLLVDKDKIKGISYITKYFIQSEDEEVVDYAGWVSFSSCPGNLVIIMDNACFIKWSYARGGCTENGNPLK